MSKELNGNSYGFVPYAKGDDAFEIRSVGQMKKTLTHARMRGTIYSCKVDLGGAKW